MCLDFYFTKKEYSDTNLRICLGIRSDGIQGGIKELFEKYHSSLRYDLNEYLVRPGEVAHIEVEDHDTFKLSF